MIKVCGHAVYHFVCVLSNYLLHVLISDVVLLFSFFDFFNDYDFCVNYLIVIENKKKAIQ